MFTKTFFKFLAGFLSIVALGVLGATISSRYLAASSSMLANTEDGK
ncbi:MAG: hypothetical protein HYT94_00870 [Parcubacteria group bacterium]|nr:hypothetical protein [Parcubacteria group bacterium]